MLHSLDILEKILEHSGKSPQRWGLRPQTPLGLRRLGAPPPDPRVVTPITCYTYFLEGVCSANVITVKRKKKKLEIAIIFCFCPSFLNSNSAQVTLANTTGSNLSAS